MTEATGHSEATGHDPVEFARRLAAEGNSAGSATAWFDELYAASEQGRAVVPWDRGQPHPVLVEWAERTSVRGEGRPALVVGTGPGHDAEYLAALGFQTTAFDVSPTAVAAARARFPASGVDYVVADLLALPAQWQEAFSLVVEVFTVQSLPRTLHEQATAAVSSTIAPGGTLLLITAVTESDDGPVAGPPWPLTSAELAAFGSYGLDPVTIEEAMPDRWRAEFRRPG
jgi:threonine dehydrogenase-like Zn-dependent dehydrogenase